MNEHNVPCTDAARSASPLYWRKTDHDDGSFTFEQADAVAAEEMVNLERKTQKLYDDLDKSDEWKRALVGLATAIDSVAETPGHCVRVINDQLKALTNERASYRDAYGEMYRHLKPIQDTAKPGDLGRHIAEIAMERLARAEATIKEMEAKRAEEMNILGKTADVLIARSKLAECTKEIFDAQKKIARLEEEIERLNKARELADEEAKNTQAELRRRIQAVEAERDRTGALFVFSRTEKDTLLVENQSLRKKAAKCDRYDAALSKLMPADFKDWHQNNPEEWPVVACAVIEGLRKREAYAEECAQKTVADYEAQFAQAHDAYQQLLSRTETAEARVAELETAVSEVSTHLYAEMRISDNVLLAMNVLSSLRSRVNWTGSLNQVLALVVNERKRQDAKWGADRNLPPYLWNTILMEEVGEVAEASFDAEKKTEHLIEELVQVAAVATAYAESMMRLQGEVRKEPEAGKEVQPFNATPPTPETVAFANAVVSMVRKEPAPEVKPERPECFGQYSALMTPVRACSLCKCSGDCKSAGKEVQHGNGPL